MLVVVQVYPVGRSEISWRRVSGWTDVSIPITDAADADDEAASHQHHHHQYRLDGLAMRSYYELEVQAINDLDRSPSLRPPFVFFTHPGRLRPGLSTI